MELNNKMALFSELVQCGNQIYLWCYDADGNLLYSNCPDKEFLAEAFDLFGCKQHMLSHGKIHASPITLGTSIGMMWAAAFDKEMGHAWVIGPVFHQDVSLRGIEKGLCYYKHMEISVSWTMQLYEILKKVPVLQYMILSRYTLMMHFCLTDTHLEVSDIDSESFPAVDATTTRTTHDRHRVWMAEQGLLQMVRTGDLNYTQAFSTGISISAGVPVHSDDVLRQSKISTIVFTSLVCRAAIEGGLSPEEAYAVGDQYIQSAESVKTNSDLSSLCNMMYDDFIHRVHKCRTNPKLSCPIQKCVEYIEIHLNEKMRASDLAKFAGYNEYYLTRKFKEETGLSVNDYIKFVKIERAKVLLKSTNQSVQEISDYLCFGTRNYFTHVFQEVVGQTPIQYRER